MLLFLVGYMGCGKSTMGRQIARSKDVHFIDMDTEIEAQYGATVSEIFATEGEPQFRKMEREVLDRIVARYGSQSIEPGLGGSDGSVGSGGSGTSCGSFGFGGSVVSTNYGQGESLVQVSQREDAIVATGGGVACFSGNMDLMNSAGRTVYLKMSPEKLASRLEGAKVKRPLIRDKSKEELLKFISDNLKQREPYYMRAKVIIDCDSLADNRIVDHINAAFGFI